MVRKHSYALNKYRNEVSVFIYRKLHDLSQHFLFFLFFPFLIKNALLKLKNNQEGMVAAKFSRERLSLFKQFLPLVWPYVYVTH